MDHEENNYKNPCLTVDAIVSRFGMEKRMFEVLLVERKNPPYGWALPGGFVDYGESTENAVVRELKEETGLTGINVKLVDVASDPTRDPRQHTVSIIYKVDAEGEPIAADDAKNVGWFDLFNLPDMAFDHKKILNRNLTKIIDY